MGAAEYRKICEAGINTKALAKQYDEVCDAYRDAPNEMWDTYAEWVDTDHDLLDVADCIIGISEIRELVDRAVDFDTFYSWYNYDMQIRYGKDLGHEEAESICLRAWLNGFPERKKVPEETRDSWEKEYFESHLIRNDNNSIDSIDLSKISGVDSVAFSSNDGVATLLLRKGVESVSFVPTTRERLKEALKFLNIEYKI